MNARRRRRVEALRTILDPVFVQIATLTDYHNEINDLAQEEFGRRERTTPEGRALNEAERHCREAIRALRALDDALFTAATGAPRQL